MPILLQCCCGASYRVADQYAGRTVHCQRCQTVLAVPAGLQPASEPAMLAIVEEIDEPVVRPDKASVARDRPHRDRPRKRGRKKGRRVDGRPLSLEDRMAQEDEQRCRRHRIRRGLWFVACGFLIMVIGAMLTWLFADLVRAGEIEKVHVLVTALYKAGGIWGPFIICTLGGLIPLVIGFLNLFGIGIVIESED
jgi:hypothetical protein